MAWGDLKDTPLHPLDERRTYRISFPWTACDIAFPVGVCPGRSSSWSALWVHFVHLHMQDTLVVLVEGNYPLPCCPKCDIFATWRALNGTHQVMSMCTRGVERRLKRLWEEESRRIMVMDFEAYGSLWRW